MAARSNSWANNDSNEISEWNSGDWNNGDKTKSVDTDKEENTWTKQSSGEWDEGERSAGWSKPADAGNTAQWSTADDESGFNIGTWDLKTEDKSEQNNANENKASASNWTALPDQNDW